MGYENVLTDQSLESIKKLNTLQQEEQDSIIELENENEKSKFNDEKEKLIKKMPKNSGQQPNMNSLFSSFDKKHSVNLEPSTDIDNMNTIAL